MKSTFEYDNDGNRTLESYIGGSGANSVYYQVAAVTYDAANRVTEFNDVKADIKYKYDAVGNRREVLSVYTPELGGALQTQDYWYKYDSANRFVLTMGALSGGVISTGTSGVALTYDAAGNRKTAAYGYDGHMETYSYTADGYLENMSIAGVVRAKRTYDAMGRVTGYNEYASNGTTSLVARMTSYDNDNRVAVDTSDTLSGSDTIHSVQSYDYKLATSSTSGYTGADQGEVTHIRNAQYTNSDSAHTVTTDTGFFYDWWDEAKQAAIRITGSDPSNRNAGSWAPGMSSLAYDVNGHIVSLTDANAPGGPRVVTYKSDAYGQVMVSEEKDGAALGPRHLYYYFNGNRIGDVGNDGVAASQVDYAAALAREGAKLSANKSAFRNGKPVASADFDENYQPINAQYPGAAASLYTVRSGDTLASIAQAAWGDASLWYLIADANGLGASSQLVAGQRLSIPNKVTNLHDNSATFKVYDPGEAIGDTLPTLPNEPAPPSHHHGCGVFGQILLIAVAVAVSYFAGPEIIGAVQGVIGTTAGAIVGGAVTGAVASVASQGVGVATGIQDSFSFKGVALAAIAGGVGGAIGGGSLIKGAGNFVNGAVRGALSNVLTQGVELATGLQNKFDWTGVAVGAAVGGATADVAHALASPNGLLGVHAALNSTGSQVVSGMAGSIAGAATRSLIDGSDFGDNLLAALPDVIGNTIGNLAAEGIASIGAPNSGRVQYAANGLPPGQQRDYVDRDEIVVTATRAQVDAAKHSLGWRIADFLGFHGGSGSTFDTSAIASSVSATFRRARDFESGVVHGVYDVGAGLVTGAYHLVTTNPLTTLRSTGYALAGGIDSILSAEDTPAIVQLNRAAGALSNASAYDLGYGFGSVGGNVALLAAPGLAAGRFGAVGEIGAAETTAGRGAYFFDQQALPYINRADATLGQTGQAHFFMPLEDSAVVTDAASAYRYTGGAPSLERAYTSGGDVFGVEFPLNGLSSRLPTAADTTLPHFLEGGNTALRLGRDGGGGYLVNPTREFVVPGGGSMPSGSTLFKIGPNGTRIPIRGW